MIADGGDNSGNTGNEGNNNSGSTTTEATLSALTIGSLTLTPAFDAEVTEYTATTSNNSNKITATSDGDVTITVNGTAHENGTSATWETGENTVVVSVGNKTYTVTVTKE